MHKIYRLIFTVSLVLTTAGAVSAQSRDFKLGQWTEIHTSIAKELRRS